jgi:hypothetical protein
MWYRDRDREYNAAVASLQPSECEGMWYHDGISEAIQSGLAACFDGLLLML